MMNRAILPFFLLLGVKKHSERRACLGLSMSRPGKIGFEISVSVGPSPMLF